MGAQAVVASWMERDPVEALWHNEPVLRVVGGEGLSCLSRALYPEQQYVVDNALALGHPLELRRHREVTSSCYEKAELLGWSPERVVKALYFSDGERYVGVVVPELACRVDSASLVAEVLDIPRRRAKRFGLDRCPPGMQAGTCTPFPLRSSLEGPGRHIERIVVHDHTPVRDETVDVSIGGGGSWAHRLSCHLHYSAIFEILERSFGSRVEQRSIAAHLRRSKSHIAVTSESRAPIPAAVEVR